MRSSLIPVLLFAVVTFSSSNIIPVLSIHSRADSKTDGIFRNTYEKRNIISKLLCEELTSVYQLEDIPKPCRYFVDENIIYKYISNDINSDINFNTKGFIKQQWHNYPRQLDRLPNEQYESDEIDDKANRIQNRNIGLDNQEDVPTNEYTMSSNNAPNNILHDSLSTSSVSVPKIRITGLNSKSKYVDMSHLDNIISEIRRKSNSEIDGNKVVPDPRINSEKLYRHGINEQGLELSGETAQDGSDNIPVKKRIFSLWSRLQALAPTSHELHHRRNLHAFYGLPQSMSHDMALTAETRAFMRPAGSPLRWG